MKRALLSNRTEAQLHQVAPLPITEPFPEDTIPVSRKHRNILQSIISVLLKTQKYAAYGFLSFFGLHISSTVVTTGLGINATLSQNYFEMARAIYSRSFFEYIFVYGCGIVHVLSGVIVRMLRFVSFLQKKSVTTERDIIINDERTKDIDSEGLWSIFGYGFKKLWIFSTIPSLNPLTFSGYVMATALSYHLWKMKWAPTLVDGDTALINLKYVTHYLSRSVNGTALAALNLSMLALLLWVSFYHIFSGLFKYRRQFSSKAKKIAYGVISVFTTLSLLSIRRLMLWSVETGFIGAQFNKYLMR